MFIKYNECELFDFFEKEPAAIGDYEAGNLIYTYCDDKLKLVFMLSTYELSVDISISYDDRVIYSETFESVVEVTLADGNILKIVSEDRRVIIKKYPQIGAIVEKV